MKENIHNLAKRHGFKLYDRPNGYLVYRNHQRFNEFMTDREFRRLIKKIKHELNPLTKPRFVCKTPRPGCPCCDSPKPDVKILNRRAERRITKKEMLKDIDEI
jgi:hypothetical protein